MLFKSREAATIRQRFRVWLWPRVSWRRSVLYFVKRTLRLSGTPYAIAMGAAIGAFVACTPFIGLHILITFALAWLVRANMIAGAIGTVFGNPATFPFIWAGAYEIGQFMLHGGVHDAPAHLSHDLLEKSIGEILPIIEPMVVGSIPIGLAAGCIVYFIVYKAVAAYQEARRKRLAGRRQAEGAGANRAAAAASGNGS
jgi:uncharacterized protein (DUF2062 family)